jgi:hypothetical protein
MSMNPDHPGSDSDTGWHNRDGKLKAGEEDSAEVRGAYLNGRLLWVLVLSMLATLIAFVCIWAFGVP